MACGRTIPRAFALGLAVFAMAFAVVSPSVAEPAKGDVTVDVSGGYARLIFAIGDDIDATARLAGNVLIISFSQPTMAGIGRLAAQAPDYISAARRDPDGRAVRMAVARKVKVHSITAAGKFFVDLLPDSWSGAPPGLPQDVVEELARLAREAERLERRAHQSAVAKKPAAGARARRQPADLYALCLRCVGSDLGCGRPCQGPTDADVRCPDRV